KQPSRSQEILQAARGGLAPDHHRPRRSGPSHCAKGEPPRAKQDHKLSGEPSRQRRSAQVWPQALDYANRCNTKNERCPAPRQKTVCSCTRRTRNTFGTKRL